MPTSELRNKARPEFCGSLCTGYRSTGTGLLSGNNTRKYHPLLNFNEAVDRKSAKVNFTFVLVYLTLVRISSYK